jgi:hypothetical protein
MSPKRLRVRQEHRHHVAERVSRRFGDMSLPVGVLMMTEESGNDAKPQLMSCPRMFSSAAGKSHDWASCLTTVGSGDAKDYMMKERTSAGAKAGLTA